jgi:hypothetical protein
VQSVVKSPGSQISVGLSPLRKFWQRFIGFLFPPETDTWLAVLRSGLGLQVIVYALFLRSDWHYLFASSGKGLVGREVGEAITAFDSPLIPTFGWLVAFGRNLNMSEETVLTVAWVGLLSAGCLLLLGLLSRPAAIVAWFVHLCAAESGGLLAYGADSFMTTALFYLMLSPLPDHYSFDHWVTKTKPKNPLLLGFWRRVLQVHLCFVYFIGGLAKCLGNGWWDGSNLWRSLIRPPFNLVPPDRGCILLMHAAIGLMMGLFLFALVMIVMNLAGIWRSHYGQESTGDFSNCQAINIHTKATGFGPAEPAVLKA